MPSQNGKLYGLTILSPIREDAQATPSHDLQIRKYLATLPTDEQSPFAQVPGTHLCRLVVMDDVVFVGAPAVEEHLNSKYLIFECNLDLDAGGLDEYLRGMAQHAAEQVDAVWSHCTAYPGARDVEAFVKYMKACQIETTFFFAAVNDKSLPETLLALQTQRAVADFIASHQGMEPAQLRAEFLEFAAMLKAEPLPRPGTGCVDRQIKMGGRNE